MTEQGDTACSVSVFDDRDTAMDAHRRVRDRVDTNMRDPMPEAPEIVAGETAFDSIARPQKQTEDRQRSLFAVLRVYRGLPGGAETMQSGMS